MNTMNTKKMLLVEDDQSFVQLVKLALREFDIDFETADDGLVALNLLSKTRFDLVMCDYRLPHLNGTEIIKTTYENSPGCKVILVSAADTEVLAEIEKMPLAGFIRKPCTPVELREVVRNLL